MSYFQDHRRGYSCFLLYGLSIFEGDLSLWLTVVVYSVMISIYLR